MERTPNVLELTAGDVMTPNPITIDRDLLAVEALQDHGNAQDHVGRRRRRRAEGRRRRAPARSVAHADVLALRVRESATFSACLTSRKGIPHPAAAVRRGWRPHRRPGDHARRRHGVEGIPHPRRRGHRLGAAGRSSGRPALRPQFAERPRTGPPSSRSESWHKGSPASWPATSRSCDDADWMMQRSPTWEMICWICR